MKLAYSSFTRMWFYTILVNCRAFYATLKTSQDQNFCDMIKTIEVNCFVLNWYMQNFHQQPRLLLQACPRLFSFALRPHVQLFPMMQLAVLQPNVTHLSLDKGVSMGTLRYVFEAASTHLVSFHFHISPDDSSIEEMLQIVFPVLQTLSIWMHSGTSWWFNRFAALYELPSLRHTTFSLRHFHHNGDFSSSSLERFFDAHSLGLRYLQITSQYLWTRDIVVQSILDCCPALEHIALFPEFVGIESLRHPRIKWVDIWVTPCMAPESYELRRTVLSREGFPSLKGVRVLPYFLQELPCPTPLLLPPDLVTTPSDTFSIQFLNSGI
ncbi:hypothetical protein CPB84DRAFT_1930011 [Gymnopilus junonius]|uniref:Uncharacterized protein n=1 Tax=Gymnopilus junonius TaxID=109634 RepID=A0A9P5P100_GYMJU|nr:hypothetical protein CPB84DRAFT_1930011 [Gymnopilus junonius]